MNKKLREYQRIWDKKADYLFQVAVWLFENKNNKHEYFDYPDYAGMPKKLSKKLSSYDTDCIQENWDSILASTRFAFIRDIMLKQV